MFTNCPRKMKIISLFVVLSLSLSIISGCQSAKEPSAAAQVEQAPPAQTLEPSVREEQAAIASGTYTGSGVGMMGPVSVSVTISDSRITDVVVTEHNETMGIGYDLPMTPVESFPALIVENQTLDVDMVSGATFTSRAIISAVADALKQAGGDASSLGGAKPAAVPAKKQDLSCDVVVVGSGAAGLAAALEAATEGGTVIVVEKQAIPGGTSARSGGKVAAAGTQYQKNLGLELPTDVFSKYLLDIARGKGDKTKIDLLSNNSASTIDWLVENGIILESVEPVHFTLPYYAIFNIGNKKGTLTTSTYRGGEGQGGFITTPLYNNAVEKGVQFLFSTPATSLLTDENGSVTGVECTKSDGSIITVHAGATILATGGYAANAEMMTEHKELGGTLNNFVVPSSCTGDGLRMAEAVGADTVQAERAMTLLSNNYLGEERHGLVVNQEGKRFTPEYDYFFSVYNDLADTGSYMAYFITDENDSDERVQAAIATGQIVSAPSIEELAGKIGLDAATLKATVDRYNVVCAAGEDMDFGKDPVDLRALDGKMFYAFDLNPNVFDTYEGVVTDAEARVLDKEARPIKGLYAAGSVSFCGVIGNEYPCCGIAIADGLYFGRVAARNAVAEAK